MKLIKIVTEEGLDFTVDIHEVAVDRALYYKEKGYDYTHEYTVGLQDEYEMKDWLQNNMDWHKCNSLKALPREDKKLSELTIESCEVL